VNTFSNFALTIKAPGRLYF